MNPESPAAGLFDHLRVRSLVLWISIGIVLLIIADIVLTLLDKSLGKFVYLNFMIMWQLLWLHFKLKKCGVTFRAFIGRLPGRCSWMRWVIITIGLMIFSIGCVFLVWYPLSFLCPHFVKRN